MDAGHDGRGEIQISVDADDGFEIFEPPGTALLPLRISDVDVDDIADPHSGLEEGNNPPRSLTFLNGLALVIGSQIGSGIFSAPSVVISHVQSPLAAIAVWCLAGILVWTGAATFIELGTIVPENGGIQEYLIHCYGDIFGFLFAWIWILLVKPCSLSMIAFIFSEYLYRVFAPEAQISMWILKITTISTISLVTYVNCMGTHLGAGAANIFLVLKILGLASIIVVAIATVVTGLKPNDVDYLATRMQSDWSIKHLTKKAEPPGKGPWSIVGSFTDATFAALFAYGGWESIGFVVGELKDPLRNLPRVLNGAMAIVTTLFIMSNISYLVVLSPEALGGANTIAETFGMATIGRPGAIFFTSVVCVSCLGSLHSNIFSAGRLTQAAGRRMYLPAFLNAASNPTENTHSRAQELADTAKSPAWTCWFPIGTQGQNVPRNAMILNACLATIYTLLGSFRGLLIFKGMTEYLVYFTTVLGVLVLRFRSATGQSKPVSECYRTWVVNPVVFCCISAFITMRSAVSHKVQAMIIALFFGSFALVYRSGWWWRITKPTES